MKSNVILFLLFRLKTRHKRLREVLLPAQAQSLDVFSEGRLCVGYQSGFTIYSLLGDQHPLCKSKAGILEKKNRKYFIYNILVYRIFERAKIMEPIIAQNIKINTLQQEKATFCISNFLFKVQRNLDLLLYHYLIVMQVRT